MVRKTKADLLKVLDECAKSGYLPNKERLSRTNFNAWLKGEYYYGDNGQHITGGERVYNEWYANKGVSYKVVTPVVRDSRNEKQGIDPSINILEDDLDIEEGLSEGIEPYVITQCKQKILVISDIHLPYQNLTALRLAINYGRTEQVNTVVLNGDICDFFSISRHSKRPDMPSMRHEIDLCKQFLQQLRKLFPSEKIIYKAGNHENRLERYIHDRAPELFGIEALTLPELFGFRDLKIEYVKSNQLIQAGKIWIAHGHEVPGGGQNIARSKRTKVNDNILFSHHHRTDSDFKKSVTGVIHGGWAIGCLCDLQPDYLPINEWNHGFSMIELNDDGTFIVHNKKIISGKVY